MDQFEWDEKVKRETNRRKTEEAEKDRIDNSEKHKQEKTTEEKIEWIKENYPFPEEEK